MENKANLFKQMEWEARPNEELKIPEAYITELRYEINVFTPKKIFSFRCKSWGQKHLYVGAYHFEGVIIDSSMRNAKGEVELKRLTYHPEIDLVAVPFMVIPAPEASIPSDADS